VPLYAAAAGWILGVWYASRWDGPWPAYVVGACAALGALWLGRSDRRLLLLAAFALALILGAARMDSALGGRLARLSGSGEVAIRGVVSEQRSRGVYIVRVEQPARGTLLLYAGRGSKLRYGDLVRVRGQAAPEADWEPWERGLARSTGAALVFRRPRVELLETGRGGRVGSLLWRVRSSVSLLLERHVPQRYSPVAEGLLLGGSLRLDPEIKAAFRQSGTSHILAASGYNVSVLAALLLALLRPLLGTRRALPPVLLAILAYAGLAGFSASVVRAALMGGITVVGVWLGRPRDSGRALAAAAVLMTLLHPHAVFDIGAQLSFAATAGLIWLLPPVLRALRRVPRSVAEPVGVALVAQLTTLPLGLYYFGGLSPWSLLANVIIAPLVPAGMLLSALTLATGVLWYPLGELCGRVTGAVLAASVGVAQAVSELPGSGLQTERVPLPVVWLYYAALLLALWLPARLPGQPVIAESGTGV
jgi:competence protein ComEC